LAAVIQGLHRFRGLRPDFPGSALSAPCPKARPLTTRQASLDAADRTVASPKGLLTLGFDPARFQTEPPACYRASWQLPGPDLHRQATTSFRFQLCSMASPPTLWTHEELGLRAVSERSSFGTAVFRWKSAQSNLVWSRSSLTTRQTDRRSSSPSMVPAFSGFVPMRQGNRTATLPEKRTQSPTKARYLHGLRASGSSFGPQGPQCPPANRPLRQRSADHRGGELANGPALTGRRCAIRHCPSRRANPCDLGDGQRDPVVCGHATVHPAVSLHPAMSEPGDIHHRPIGAFRSFAPNQSANSSALGVSSSTMVRSEKSASSFWASAGPLRVMHPGGVR
jgi:hypothetical protein